MARKIIKMEAHLSVLHSHLFIKRLEPPTTGQVINYKIINEL
jgi:hypothetical protein